MLFFALINHRIMWLKKAIFLIINGSMPDCILRPREDASYAGGYIFSIGLFHLGEKDIKSTNLILSGESYCVSVLLNSQRNFQKCLIENTNEIQFYNSFTPKL